MTQVRDDVKVVNVVELNRYAPRPFVFTDLALCLRDSIRSAGIESNVTVNDADPNAASIVIGAMPDLGIFVSRLDPARTALLNLEQLGSNSHLVGKSYLNWLRDRLVVDYHSANVAYLKSENGPAQRVFEIPIVPSPSIDYFPERQVEKTVDVLFFGTRNNRRSELLQRLEEAGMKLEVVSGAYGKDLTPAILRAKIIVHAHFYETSLFPIARILQPVIQSIPVVCEESKFSTYSDWSDSGVRFASYDNLVEVCHALLQSPDEQMERAHRTLQFARQLDFRTPFTLLNQAFDV